MARTTDSDFFKDSNSTAKYSTHCFCDYSDPRWYDAGLESSKEITIVYNLCCKFINRRDLLEDLIQSSLIELWRTFEKYREREVKIIYRSSFIRRVVMSSLIQTYIRKNSSEMLYKTTDMVDGLDASYENEIIKSVCGDNSYLKKVSVDLIDSLIEGVLNVEDSMIAYCYFHLGYTQAEIAEYLGKSQSVISNKLAEIRDKIKIVTADLE